MGFIFNIEITCFSKKWDRPRVITKSHIYKTCFWYANTFTSEVIVRQLSTELGINIYMYMKN